MKICIFGEKDNKHTEMLVNLFSSKHDVMLHVDDIGAARELMAKNKNNIKITYNPIDIENIQIFIICTETGFNELTRKVDITKLSETVELIKRYARTDSTVIIESIVSVGTTRKLFGTTGMKAAYSQFRLDDELLSPKDIPKLIGGIDEKSERVVMEIYSTVFNVVVRTGSSEIAEGAALLERSARIVQKAFINEFADFCSRINLDVHHVIDAAGAKLLPSPWIGNNTKDHSAHHLIYHEDDWPVLYSAVRQLEHRPKKIYEKIVEIYCGKDNYDELHKKCFLVVGLGDEIGSNNTKNSPVLSIIHSLELEGAKVIKFDMFIEEYSKVPEMNHNSGLPRFDGILVFHPYLVSEWEKYHYTTFFCRH